MNYYIQGNKDKAEEIKVAFEKLGYDTSRHFFNTQSVLYFTLDGKIRATTCNCTPAIIKTHPNYKELELPIEPKFKVGDYIIWNEPKGSKPTEPVKIIRLIDKDQLYMVDMQNGVGYVAYDMQDYYKLVPKSHYGINKFHAGMPVLVRADNDCSWDYSVFSRITGNEYCKFSVCNGVSFTQCIPFNEKTKHLLGTTDMCDEQYINW